MNKNKKLALSIISIAFGMFAFSFAAVPLYSLFCKVTGYGGTTQIASSKAQSLGVRDYFVRFDASVNPDLYWEFAPMQKQVKVKPGENSLIFYKAKNLAKEAVEGVATFNVTPQKVGMYFNKVQCFCFDKQTLKPGEEVIMPVSFFIDPAIEKDKNVAEVDTITLSYTFFEAE